MEGSATDEGVYRISAARSLICGASRELPDALPPLAPDAPPLPWGGSFEAPLFGMRQATSPAAQLSSLLAALNAAVEGGRQSEDERAPSDDLSASAPSKRYGWVSGWLPAPDAAGRYVVEFVERRAVRILAYFDKFGRAFATDEPLESPPAREPDLRFARYADQPDSKALSGCVETKDGEGNWREVARFRRERNRYMLFDSWFDFGKHADDLVYPDAMARCYLAFVHRPSLGAPEVPERGLAGVEAPLGRFPAVEGIKRLSHAIARAQWDPALKPPALARALAQWLSDAGERSLPGMPNDALRLVKTVRYADIYYLGVTEAGEGVPLRDVWGLQNALNRYLLAKESFGERASLASMADVLRWDAYLIESVAADAPDAAHPHEDAPSGEWELRRALAEAAERLRAPLRFELDFRVDVEAGAVAFKAMVPDAALMPRRRWDEAEGAVDASAAHRAEQALRYAEHLALYFMAEAFSGCPRIDRVEFAAYPPVEARSVSLGDALAAAGEEDGSPDSAGGLSALLPKPHLFVSADRARFREGFASAAKGDPRPFFEALGAQVAAGAFSVEDAGPFSEGLAADRGLDADPYRRILSLPSAQRRRDLPEFSDAELPERLRAALGARWARDLRINAEAFHRRQAERLANRLAPAPGTAAAIGIVRRVQRKADDPFVDRCLT